MGIPAVAGVVEELQSCHGGAPTPIGLVVNPADPANVLMRAAGRDGLAVRVVEA